MFIISGKQFVFNPFPRIDAFWHLWPLHQMTFWKHSDKKRIAQIEQFLLLPQCFPSFSHRLFIIHSFNHRDFLFFDKICSKSSAAELSYEGKGWLTLSHLQKDFYTSAADDFWKHCDKRSNCSSIFNVKTHIYGNVSHFCQNRIWNGVENTGTFYFCHDAYKNCLLQICWKGFASGKWMKNWFADSQLGLAQWERDSTGRPAFLHLSGPLKSDPVTNILKSVNLLHLS